MTSDQAHGILLLALAVVLSTSCQIDNGICAPTSQESYNSMADAECRTVSLLGWTGDEIQLSSLHPDASVLLPSDPQARIVSLDGFRAVIGGSTESMHLSDLMSGNVSSPDLEISLRSRHVSDCDETGRNLTVGLRPDARVRISVLDQPDCFTLFIGDFVSGSWENVQVALNPEAAPTETLMVYGGLSLSLAQLQDFGSAAGRVEIIDGDDAPVLAYSEWLVSQAFGGELWLCERLADGKVCQTRVLPVSD